jgi:hypothetical protein
MRMKGPAAIPFGYWGTSYASYEYMAKGAGEKGKIDGED